MNRSMNVLCVRKEFEEEIRVNIDRIQRPMNEDCHRQSHQD